MELDLSVHVGAYIHFEEKVNLYDFEEKFGIEEESFFSTDYDPTVWIPNDEVGTMDIPGIEYGGKTEITVTKITECLGDFYYKHKEVLNKLTSEGIKYRTKFGIVVFYS